MPTTPRQFARSFGVMFDYIVTCMLMPPNINRICPFLTVRTDNTLIVALSYSCLDYCNTLLIALSLSNLSKVQRPHWHLYSVPVPALVAHPTKEKQLALECDLNEGIALGVIDDKVREHLINKFPVCPVFHSLPKIHKGTFPPPLRPIVAGIGSAVENTCIWLDSLLQPLVQRVPGYRRDCKELLKAFDNMQWDDRYRWVTGDVTALYTCIPHNKAWIALSFHLRKYSNYSCELREFILMVTTFLLSHNSFTYNGDYVLWICGCPMGACFSPSLANLYMSCVSSVFDQ